MSGSLRETLKMIKIEHSIFALPFALIGAFWAAGGLPEMRILFLILLAMVLARSAAMAFNRYLDADIDGQNPRTQMRAIPAGRLTRSFALGFTIVCSLLFVATAWLLNPLAFWLSPMVLLVLLGYSYTKRFTAFCHLVLGLALGLAPFGAWVAVRGEAALTPLILGLAVMFWTAGFDMIYACQDHEFDRQNRVFSMPVRLGVGGALLLARVLHVAMLLILVYLGLTMNQGAFYWAGLVLVLACLIYEHALVWGGNLEKVDMAFFMMNGVVSLGFGLAVITGVLVA